MFAKRYFAIGEYLRSNLHANPLWRRQGSSFYLLTQTDLASLIQREYPECTVLLLEMHTEVKYLFLHAHVAAAADLSRQLLQPNEKRKKLKDGCVVACNTMNYDDAAKVKERAKMIDRFFYFQNQFQDSIHEKRKSSVDLTYFIFYFEHFY